MDIELKRKQKMEERERKRNNEFNHIVMIFESIIENGHF